ncbi:FeoA family protein [Okeanomitos corallinicola TIOX110]|uniref:FeoA family protein n=1 Tax=Okeanomitos corallinicola TIOX110 TaxID=3133117 RepID=A0ABZ2UWU3_9CYAN
MDDFYHLSSFHFLPSICNYYLEMFTPFTVTGCSLELLKPGDKGIVTVCKTQDEKIRKKLIALGIRTGTNITLEQQFPSILIKAANVTMSIDRETARAIYIRVVDV